MIIIIHSHKQRPAINTGNKANVNSRSIIINDQILLCMEQTPIDWFPLGNAGIILCQQAENCKNKQPYQLFKALVMLCICPKHTIYSMGDEILASDMLVL